MHKFGMSAVLFVFLSYVHYVAVCWVSNLLTRRTIKTRYVSGLGCFCFQTGRCEVTTKVMKTGPDRWIVGRDGEQAQDDKITGSSTDWTERWTVQKNKVVVYFCLIDFVRLYTTQPLKAATPWKRPPVSQSVFPIFVYLTNLCNSATRLIRPLYLSRLGGRFSGVLLYITSCLKYKIGQAVSCYKYINVVIMFCSFCPTFVPFVVVVVKSMLVFCCGTCRMNPMQKKADESWPSSSKFMLAISCAETLVSFYSTCSDPVLFMFCTTLF